MHVRVGFVDESGHVFPDSKLQGWVLLHEALAVVVNTSATADELDALQRNSGAPFVLGWAGHVSTRACAAWVSAGWRASRVTLKLTTHPAWARSELRVLLAVPNSAWRPGEG